MAVLVSPARFPQSISYRFANDGAVSRHMLRILNLLCPSSPCTGFGDLDEADNEEFVVACDADWASFRVRWRAKHADERKLVVMPVPEGDTWSYWDFFIKCIDRLQFDGYVAMSVNDFADFVVHDRQRGQISEDGSLQLFAGSYLSFQSNETSQGAGHIQTVAEALSDDASKTCTAHFLMGRRKLSGVIICPMFLLPFSILTRSITASAGQC